MDFYTSWWWLHNHPINLKPFVIGGKTDDNMAPIKMGLHDIYIYVARVDPYDNKINVIDTYKNTKTQVWLEFGKYVNYTDIHDDLPDLYQREHDPALDCGGDTFEIAIMKLAELVLKYYGDYADGS